MKGKGTGLTARSAKGAVSRFRGTRVLVVGDIMVDRYFWGRVQRISPEAPVPVVEVEQESRRLGGAANVAHNIKALGGTPLLCGTAGEDREGEWLLSELERLGMDSSGVFRSKEIPTTVKSRIVAHSQQVVRFDREVRGRAPEPLPTQVTDFLREQWREVEGAVVSDYNKGMIDESLMESIRRINRGRNSIPVSVDPKSTSLSRYRGATVITPNQAEALASLTAAGKGTSEIDEAGKRLLAMTRARAVLITRGEDGMSLFERGRKALHIPTVAREVYDVTGAGDTVIGALALALASKSDLRRAAFLANAAAAVVVGEFGTVPATQKQLLESLRGRTMP